jgi:hypothetical protein
MEIVVFDEIDPMVLGGIESDLDLAAKRFIIAQFFVEQRYRILAKKILQSIGEPIS